MLEILLDQTTLIDTVKPKIKFDSQDRKTARRMGVLKIFSARNAPNEDEIKVLLASQTKEYMQEIQSKAYLEYVKNNEASNRNEILNVESLLEIGEKLYKEGKYSEAVEEFLKIINITENNYFAQYNVGLCYLELKEYSKAEKHLTTASQLRPFYSSPYISLGSLYYHQNQFSSALTYYQFAEQLDPSPAIYYNIGRVYHTLKEYNKAILHYERAIDIDPSYASAHNGLGIVYDDLQEYNNAILHYEKAINIDPFHANAHNNLGYLYYNLKEYNKAILNYEKAIDIDPSHSLAHNNLGNVYQ